VIHVNWDDAKAYASWLSGKTAKTYRLLSEAEREHVARAGTTTPFWWGSSITPQQANYDGSGEPYKGGGSKGEYRQRTVPVDSYEANPWGLYNVHGNIWEWTEDCWNDGNNGNPGNGSARETGDCSSHVLRGGSWYLVPRYLRAAYRDWSTTDTRSGSYGIRLARTLEHTDATYLRTQVELNELLTMAARRIERGDVTGAREMLASADDGAQGPVAFALAETYDPNMLGAWGSRDVAADIAKAKVLYRKALSLGVARAQTRLEALK
jgi:hypothetical protein